MKLIIDIPEEAQKNIFKVRFLIGGKEDRILQQIIINAIKNGTPLDDVKAEIREQQKDYREWGWAYDDVLEILDNVGNAESQKPVGLLNQSLEDAIDCS